MPYQFHMHGERTTCAGPARCDPGAPRRSRRAGHAYDPAQNLAQRTNNAGGSTVTATVNALNQLTAGLGFSGSLAYDRRGNLLSIGSAGSGRAFAYDHENQCVTAGWFNAYTKSDFVYDGKGRLRKRTDYTWNGSNWTPTGETRYVYDGMLLVQERTSAGHPAVTYTRGLDLSGTLEGAGGIGGLLARTTHQSTSPYQPSTHAFYHADGNGNVTYLLNQARTHGASYRYDPYGRLIASSGGLAGGNLMRFSSKLWHDHSETYYYGYRFYLPEGQRWISRDPIEEEGGINLYAFVKNNSITNFDPLGLFGSGGVGGPQWFPPHSPPTYSQPRHMGFPTFTACMDWCMRMMNPWMLPQASCVAGSVIATGSPAIGATMGAGWTLGTAAGCSLNCL